MPLPRIVQISLDSFDLTADVSETRKEIWRLLEPEIERIADRYIEKTIRVAPAYRKRLIENRKEHVALQVQSTSAHLSHLTNLSNDEAIEHLDFDQRPPAVESGPAN